MSAAKMLSTWLSQVQIHSRRWRAQAGPSAPSRAAQPHRFLGPQLEAQRQRWLLAVQADWQMKQRYPSGTHTRSCREGEQLQLLQAVWTGIEEGQRIDSLCQLDLYISFLFGPESACGTTCRVRVMPCPGYVRQTRTNRGWRAERSPGDALSGCAGTSSLSTPCQASHACVMADLSNTIRIARTGPIHS